ncbi:MAG: Maf family protein [Pseudomonadota bacterium]
MDVQPKLILASASVRRMELLAQVDVVPDAVCPADVDETPYPGERSREYAARMAVAKCRAVLEPSALVLAADTVVSAGRRILGKPGGKAEAAEFLSLLSGRRHRVTTAVCVRLGGLERTKLVETRVQVKRLSEAELSAYLRSGEWQGKAGGYAIQGRAAAFIPWISGSYTNVVGLPLSETMTLLGGIGYPVPLQAGEA